MSRTLDILERLIAFPTVSSDSNLDLVDWVGGFLAGLGFDCTHLPDPFAPKAGLFARLGPQAGGGVILSAHSDVVPVEGQVWARPAFALTQMAGRAYGRGASDMKGFLACALAAAERAAAGASLSRPLMICLSYDEEVGCRGIKQMMPALMPLIGGADLCVVGEPTLMKIATGHKGKIALRATFRGTTGHSAEAPLYLNALQPAAEFLLALRDMQGELSDRGARDEAYGVATSTLHAGRMTGGRVLNIVPDEAVIDFELRYLAAQPPGDILAKVRACGQEIVARYGAAAGFEMAEVNAYPGFEADPNSPAVARLAQALGARDLTKVSYGTEAGFLAQAGVPTLVCGPGSMAQGHQPDEFIELSELAACDRMLDRLIFGLAG